MFGTYVVGRDMGNKQSHHQALLYPYCGIEFAPTLICNPSGWVEVDAGNALRCVLLAELRYVVPTADNYGCNRKSHHV